MLLLPLLLLLLLLGLLDGGGWFGLRSLAARPPSPFDGEGGRNRKHRTPSSPCVFVPYTQGAPCWCTK